MQLGYLMNQNGLFFSIRTLFFTVLFVLSHFFYKYQHHLQTNILKKERIKQKAIETELRQQILHQAKLLEELGQELSPSTPSFRANSENTFIDLLQMIEIAANRATTSEEALDFALHRICAHTDWPIGHVYTTQTSGNLVSTSIWCLKEGINFEPLRRATTKRTFAPGVCLPGRVLATGIPTWIDDIKQDRYFLRAQEAEESQVCAAFAFPVLVGREVVAVLEFFSTEFAESDTILLDVDVMAHIGMQLGRIIERKRAETVLRGSEERFRKIFEEGPLGMAIITPDGDFIKVNTTLSQLIGYTESELSELTFADITHQDDVARDTLLTKQLLKGEISSYQIEKRYIKKSGDVIWIHLTSSMIRGKESEPLYGLAMIQDITERKQGEMALYKTRDELELRVQERTEELKLANEEVRRFAYIVSHDLKAPLVNLKGFASELRLALSDVHAILNHILPILDQDKQHTLQLALQEDVPEALGFIESSVTRMNHLINALLKLSRLGYREFVFEHLDMEALVHATLDSLAHQIEQQKIIVTVESLPTLVADPVSMEQIMSNILLNAVLYLQPNRQGQIQVRGERQANETVFYIQDNGRGIAKSEMHKIFEPFRRIGKPTVPGEGMGLAYVQTLIRRHSGRIWCESEVGVGTTFIFTISHRLNSGPQDVQNSTHAQSE